MGFWSDDPGDSSRPPTYFHNRDSGSGGGGDGGNKSEGGACLIWTVALLGGIGGMGVGAYFGIEALIRMLTG